MRRGGTSSRSRASGRATAAEIALCCALAGPWLGVPGIAAAAADLALGSDHTVPGGAATIDLTLGPGSGVSHLQVDLFFDPAVLTPSAVERGTGAAAHLLDWAIVEPGTLRVVLYSPDCARLTGQLVSLELAVAAGAPPGVEDVALGAAVLAGSTGDSITPAALLDGAVEIRDAAPIPEIPTLSPSGAAGLAVLLAATALLLLRRARGRGATLVVAALVVGAGASTIRSAAATSAQAVLDAILGRSAADPSLDCDGDTRVDVRDIGCLLGSSCTAPSPTPFPTATLSATATPTATTAPPTTTPSPSATPDASPTATPTAGANRAPSLTPPGDQEAREQRLFTLQLDVTDPDLPLGDVLRFSLLEAPVGMTIDPETGSLLWSPRRDHAGGHPVTARVVDLGGLADQASFLVTVTALGGPPALAPIPDQTTVEGVLLVLPASATDPDLPDDLLTFSLPLAPQGMTIDPTTGSIAWTPSVLQLGVHDVTVEVTDRQGLLDFTGFAVTVASTNEAPVAADDAYVARTGETLVVDPAGILANDADPNGDPLSAMLVDPPGQGDLDFRPDGSFEYTPTALGNRVEQSLNLSLLAAPQLEASSRRHPTSWGPERVVDDDLETTWLTSLTDTDAWFAEVFVRPVAVREIRYFGDREFGRDFTAGVFELFDRDGFLLFSSGEVVLPAPEHDAVVDVEGAAGGPVEDVSRVLFRATGYEPTSNDHGIGELHVIGDGIVEVLDAVVEWAWTAESIGSATPNDGRVMVAPTVGDLDGDGLPEVAFMAEALARLYVVNGEDGSVAWSADEIRVFSSSPALGDIDGDGLMEVIAVRSDNRTIAVFEDDGTLKTEVDSLLSVGEANLALADLDADGLPEIVVPGSARIAVYRLEAGALVRRWLSEQLGCGNNAYRTNCIPLVSDLDLDGSPEIVAGRTIYAADGTTEHHDAALPDGWNAVANLDDDPFAEIVLVAGGLVRLLEHDLTVKWGPVDPPGGGSLGAPTVADFDGDGEAEIGVAGSNRYSVLDTDGSVLWEAVTVDGSSHRTGSTVFDFQNDGSAEVVYRDERHLWVYRGVDGAVLFQTPIRSGTTVEYPIVADVDADGEAEIVAVSNVAASLPDGTTRPPGVYVFGSADGDWVRARPIWNQHTYHVTNVLAEGTVPAIEQPNWLLPGLNDFRKNDFLPDEASRADTFTYRASDGVFDSNVATVFLDLRPPNTAPRIVSSPERSATVGFAYLHTVRARDLDHDPLVFALSDGPAGMTLDAASGLLRWSPGPADLGDHTVALSVTDDDGFSGFQAFTLTVAQPVVVPDVVGLDLAGAAAALAAEGLASGAVTQAQHPSVATGLVCAQTPSASSVAEPGSAVALVESLGPGPDDTDDDGDGFTENQGDHDDADPDSYPGAPEIPGDGIDQDGDGADGTLPLMAIEIVPGSLTLLQGEAAALQAFGTFADGGAQNLTAVVSWSSTNGATAAVSAAGVVSALAAGSASIQATRDGVHGTATVEVVAADAGDDDPPDAEISSPADGASVLGPIEVLGTADDPGLVRYELAISPADENAFIPVGGGTAPVVAGLLGLLDPTLLLNDLYRLRLTVVDAGGNETTDEVTVQVEGNQKVGNFTLSFTDLAIPMAGIPITIERTYDSRDRRRGDFGVGWRLGLRTLEISCANPLGDGWLVVKSGLSFVLHPTTEHKCSLAGPDGRIEEFDFVPAPSSSAILPLSFLSGSFRARAGTRGQLRTLDNPFLLIADAQPGEAQLLDDTTLDLFAPRRFRYTAPDGTEISLRVDRGVESIRDPEGNVLVVDLAGIHHSLGKSVLFTRDTAGRITAIEDPAGNVQRYTYSAEGDLLAHTDGGGNTTRYFYDQRHGLRRVQDPLGRALTRVVYDDDGRVIQSTDATGRTISFTRDLALRREIVTAADGSTTTLEYDEAGNVTKVTDALGGETVNTYDGSGNQTSTTNPLGETTTRTFDLRGNLLTETDPMGDVRSYTYDGRDRPTSLTDPLGRASTFSYDSRGNLLTATDAGGGVTTNAYDAAGNLIAQTDPTGAATTFERDAFGAVIAVVDPLGGRRELTYDPNGTLLDETDARGTTVTGAVDARGLFSTKTDPHGRASSFEWEPSGRLAAVTDPAGRVTRRTLDAVGREIATIDALGRTTELEYGPTGNLARITDPGGAQTLFEHDVLDRRTAEIDPLGGRTATVYDAAGRIVERRDPRGSSTRFEHDAAGRTTKTIDALGHETTFVHDAAGDLVQRTDALGRTHTFVYDALGRRTETHFPGGASTRTVHDAAGRVIEEIDELGRSTRFEYDRAGRLLRVIDPLGGETSFGWDSAGNLVLQTDAGGHTTTFQYDANGRRTKILFPDGNAEVREYDLSGNVAAVTDPNGSTIDFEHDATGRVTARVFAGGRVDFSHTPTGELATVVDGRGTTSFAYDPLGRPTSIAQPDGSSLAYSYDAAGNVTSITTRPSPLAAARSVSYAYDALDRLSMVTDDHGQVTTYTYDAVGNRTRIEHPNGVTTDLVYDERNRLVQIDHRRGLVLLEQFLYTLDPVGNRVRVDELDGSFVSYQYDALRRLTRETRVDGSATTVLDVSYAYDAVGNRLARTDHLTAEVIPYTYGVNDELLSAGAVTFAYDANGNLISRTEAGATTNYEWDAEDRLRRVSDPVTGETTFLYDFAGNRVQRTDSGGVVRFLVDGLNPTGFSQVLEEYAGSTRFASYVYGADLLSLDGSAGVRRYHYDGTGSTRLLTDAAGSVSDRYTFDAFGQQQSFTGATPNPYLFAGERLDPNLGFYHLRARYYAAAVGRFVSRDPFAGSLVDPPSLHRYLYAHANPVSFTDPSGEFTLAQTVAISGIVNVVVSLGSDTVFGCGDGRRCTAEELVGRALISGALGLVTGVAGNAVVGALAKGLTGAASPLARTALSKLGGAIVRYGGHGAALVFTGAVIDTMGWYVEERLKGSRPEGADIVVVFGANTVLHGSVTTILLKGLEANTVASFQKAGDDALDLILTPDLFARIASEGSIYGSRGLAHRAVREALAHMGSEFGYAPGGRLFSEIAEIVAGKVGELINQISG